MYAAPAVVMMKILNEEPAHEPRPNPYCDDCDGTGYILASRSKTKKGYVCNCEH